MKFKIAATALLLTGLCFFVTHVYANDIKARMKARLPVINALKSKGVLGENNKGFLEFRGSKEKVNEANAENADRKKVYSAIAGKQGTTADLVGNRRAIQLRGIAKPGEWLQDDGGKWYKK